VRFTFLSLYLFIAAFALIGSSGNSSSSRTFPRGNAGDHIGMRPRSASARTGRIAA
jgi:hypothetical protein